jgi:glutaredoxin
MEMNRIDGKDRGDVTLFTLSTCIWCKKTKALLQEMAIAYRFVDVTFSMAPREKRPSKS